MPTVVVLGAAGVMGRIVVTHLTERDVDVVAVDVDETAADELTALGDAVSFEHVDVTDPESGNHVFAGADVVVNCVGPFYRFAPTVLERVIDAGVDYVDICDDYDVTETLLDDYDAPADDAGVTAIVGLGASPGMTNLLAAAGAAYLDAVESVAIRVTRSITASAGPAIAYHLFHSWLGDVPTYRDGAFTTATGLRSGRETVTFPDPFGDLEVYDFGHPEVITLPRVLDLDSVTTRGNFVPSTFRDAVLSLHDLGLLSETPVSVGETEIRPVDFSAAMLERIGTRVVLDGTPSSLPDGGAVIVEVTGERNGTPETVRYAGIASMRVATGTAAAVGVQFLLDGTIPATPGVHPPEAVVPPRPFIDRLRREPGLDLVDDEMHHPHPSSDE